jgi:hypothetical protein
MNEVFTNNSESNQTPQDNDPIWDELIWEHTQARPDINPKVLFHFTLAHYMAQYANLANSSELLSTKDDMFMILGGILLLEEVKNPGKSEIFKDWMSPKAQ